MPPARGLHQSTKTSSRLYFSLVTAFKPKQLPQKIGAPVCLYNTVCISAPVWVLFRSIKMCIGMYIDIYVCVYKYM